MSDLDLPLLPSADQIRRRKFATVRRGYDPDQVDDYLKQVAEQVEALETDLRDERLTAARQRPSGAETPVEQPAAMMAPPAAAVAAATAAAPETEEAAYERISKRFASVLKSADEEAQKLIDQARAEATKLLDDARAEADRIRVDAQANAEQARSTSATELANAREEADRVLGGLEQRRESLLGQMHEMQSRLLAVAQNLEIPDGDEAHGAHTSAPGQQAAASPAQQPTTPSEPQPTGDRPPANADATVVPEAAPVKEPAPVPVGQAATESETVDPRYEDMWASTETRQVDIPDLSSLDIDFDDEKKD
ncbi:MAG TPA: DivIVA domain-containing protein [Actinomycetota bacterium]|jgi:DivIVA domain-containing protein|nr:DivIVA domain-containing protein [Actinomycetota bacterium]